MNHQSSCEDCVLTTRAFGELTACYSHSAEEKFAKIKEILDKSEGNLYSLKCSLEEDSWWGWSEQVEEAMAELVAIRKIIDG